MRAAIGTAIGERARNAGRRSLSAVLILLVALAGGALTAWYLVQPRGEDGTFIIPQGSMTDDEARTMLDRQVESSRITVSLRPKPELSDGLLHVNFVVVPDNNGFSERLEIEQDGRVVYASGVVDPEHIVEWAAAPAAHVGAATATVYAVDDAGNDFGNPVSVEVEVV